jgi:DNA mismatch repair protein MutL
MNPKIQKILDAEKIAAGEVIERPANIIKELIENGIDADANEIKVIAKDAGKSLIQVIDNGSGIAPDELEIAFHRHTSSKIRTIDDLNHLHTLGFRGEALASISAISEVEITSRVQEDEKGRKLILKAGQIIDDIRLLSPIGTNISVKNLFYNTPARKKFLKKDSTELGHITDIIQRYALAYPEKHIVYLHNDLTILNCPLSNDLKTTVFHIYGKKIAMNLHELNFDEEGLKLHGLLGNSNIAKKNRSHSSFFINKRYIISDLLYRAIQDAYKGILMIGMFPLFILELEVDPAIVDFNVHPKKLEVRFEDEEFIYNRVFNIVRNFVESEFMKKEMSESSTNLSDFLKTPIKSNIQGNIIENVNKNDNETKNWVQLKISDNVGENIDTNESLIREKRIKATNFPSLRLISNTGQLSNKIYIILEGTSLKGEEGIYILDQHAASERITKEYFEKLFKSTKKYRQKLITPLTIEVSPSEKYFLLSEIEQIKKLGFLFEHFGGNSFILREIPVIIKKVPDVKIINEIISDITEIGKDKSFSEVKEQIINYLACHKSIRGGDNLTLQDIRNLITELSKMEDPYHCAHGRPTLKFISFKELDKLFKRIV